MKHRLHRRPWHLVIAGLVIIALPCMMRAVAQEMVFPAGQPPSAEQRKAMMEAIRAARQGGQPPGQPVPVAKPDENAQKKPEGEQKKEEADTSVKRPEKPPRVPDPREFDVKLDDKGRVPPFNFIGQPWPDVLQWLANISKSSLDWQKLPNDYLNLTTQRSYSLDEIHDLINRHLHARGYTSIQSAGVLSVFELEKLDPSLVRRVAEDELYDLKAYDYVKVSFELPADMEVDKAKDDIKQLLSPNAKVFPLVTTRRLLVMDAVANLRTVSELLNQERTVQDGRTIPKEFVLRYARPEKVIEILYERILGVDPKAKPAQTDPQMQRQQMEMMQQMQQRGGGGGGPDLAKLMGKEEAPKVHLAYNRQRNSVLANAPPKEMKIIEQAISYLDVPYGGDLSAAGGVSDAGHNVSGNQRTMQKYQLSTLDPENLMEILAEIGGLSPFAEFKVDEKSKTLFALATPQDHEKINRLVDQFDGTGREFEVIWLRRLPADAVAGTIYSLMAGQNEEEKDDDRGRFYFSFYDRDREEDKDKPVKGFGVDADIENNRLLLWADRVEMERVRGFLVKLGEIPSGQDDPRPIRFIQPGGGAVTPELLEQLQQAWSATGDNKLIIKNPPKKEPTPPADEKKVEKDAKPAQPAEDRATRIEPSSGTGSFCGVFGAKCACPPLGETGSDNLVVPAPRVIARYVQLAAPAVEPAAENEAPPADKTADSQADNAKVSPPVTISVTDDGRLMISSPDTAALDRLEELVAQLSQPDRRFRVYRLKNIKALHMYWDLTDYFADDLKQEEGGWTRDWFGFRVPTGGQDKGSNGLSRRRKLMITYDVPSNSVLVANASSSQLAEIEQLIKEFDQPAPSDSVELRNTAAIKINYSRPSIIAAAVKEVYRDLLSSRDKEFDRADQRQSRETNERVTVINYGGSSGGSGDGRPSPVNVGFDGALSLGADDISGILIVSAQRGIFDDIVRMVRELDAEAAPQTTVHVHRVSGNVTAAALQKAINEAVGKPWLGGRPEQTGTTPEANQGRGDRDRDRDRRRRNRDNDND